MQKAFLEPVLLYILKGNTWLDFLLSSRFSSKPENVSRIIWLQDLRLICKCSNKIVTKWFRDNWNSNCWAEIFNKFIPYYNIPDGKTIARDFLTQLLKHEIVLNQWGHNATPNFCISVFFDNGIYVSYNLRLYFRNEMLVVEEDEDEESLTRESYFRYITKIDINNGKVQSVEIDEILRPFSPLHSMTDDKPVEISKGKGYLHFLLPHLVKNEDLVKLDYFCYGHR
jgi:hypothetical protein